MAWELIDNIRGAQGPKGEKGDKGDTGTPATIVGVGAQTVPASQPASVTMGGTASARSFTFNIPQGAKGDQGVPGTLSSASAESVPAGENAEVIMSGTTEVKHAHFKIPRGLPGLNAVENDAAFAAALSAPDSDTGLVFRAELDERVPRHNAIPSVRDYGAVGDGVADDSAAAAAAAAGSEAVLYPAGEYLGAEGFGNAYGPTYTEAIGQRIMGGINGSPITNAQPLVWVQKHSAATRVTNPQEWDNGAVYAALVKESGDAYGAALTGFGRHTSVDGGDLIGVHGRGLAVIPESRVWGGWMYAASVGDAAVTAPAGLAGLEVNLSHRGPDTGWSASTLEGQQHGLLVMAADGAKTATRAIAIGRASSPEGFFHTGILVSGPAIAGVDAGTDFAATVGNNEYILLTGAGTTRANGIRFHSGNFGVGISFAEGNFRSGAAMVIGTHQRFVVGNGPSAPAQVEFVNDDSSNRYLNLTNMLLRVNGTAVVGTRRTGWGTPIGTVDRTAFDSSSVTLQGLAQRVAALIGDLRAHGLIGD